MRESKIKGIKKLNKAISAIFTPFGIPNCFYNTHFSYDFWTHAITYCPYLTEDDDYFSNFVENHFKIKNEMPILISFLHEIGHHKTFESLTEEEWDFCEEKKKRIFKKIRKANTPKKIDKLQNQYFVLPDELKATEWAVDFIRKHPKKAKKMNDELMKALNDFYKTNNIK